MLKQGFFGIGVFNPKTSMNVGTLWKSAHNFGAAFIFTIGARYKRQASDTTNAHLHVPFFEYESYEQFSEHRPRNCMLIGVEQSPRSTCVERFPHPQSAIYLLGAEDNGLPEKIQDKCKHIIHITSPSCLNVAVAGSVVMFDRAAKSIRESHE